MIGYVTLGMNEPARTLPFYDALLATIGAKRLMEWPENDFTMWGTGWDQPGIVLTRPYDGGSAAPGNGSMVAINVDSRDKVDALHAKAMELGGSDEGAPGLREPEAMGFYAAYFRDLEGNKLAVFNVPMPGA
ncbi:VOC family protein [Sphingomonas baiyangensis]|uniref:VOC family protein n=1 Tax=Sphingomonas baiyangensis TaxID=2572576 RepID=A0A4U1L8X4_9SPHN|nr:VOC family protein [Sphingomonas baiyangensis]TKD52820.1 VOC family protein [Sphingomonas baiyangensis]